MTKICHVDVETTGDDHKKHCVHQLAGMIQIGDEVKETFDIRIRPVLGCLMDPKALAISGVTQSQILAYPPITEALPKFARILAKYADMLNPKDKFFLSGYGVSFFDSPFIKQLFLKAGSRTFTEWFYNSTLDSSVLASYVLRNERSSMPDFKLATVAKRLGIEVVEDKLHNGEYDVQLHYEVDERLRRLLP